MSLTNFHYAELIHMSAYSFIVMVASLSIESTRYKRKASTVPPLTFGIEMSLVDINLSLDNELKQSSSTHCSWNRL